MALIISLSNVGGILYLQTTKPFFSFAPNMVFGILALYDILVLIFIVIMIMMGKYGGPAP